MEESGNFSEFLKTNEQLDDLGIKGLKIIQKSDGYRFTSDAVLLANMCGEGGVFADLGSGCGIISVLLAAKKNAEKVYAVELQPELAEMSERSVEMNCLREKIEVINADIKGCSSLLGVSRFDKVVANPPFFKSDTGEKRANPGVALCRHEIAITFAELVSEAAKLLKSGGYFYCVQKTSRLAECICELSAARLEPKKITLVYPTPDKEADVFIAECKKDAAAGTKLSSFLLYGQDGKFTSAARKLYSEEGI